MGEGGRKGGGRRGARVARGVEARHTHTHAHTTTRGLGDGGEGGEGCEGGREGEWMGWGVRGGEGRGYVSM